VIGFAAQSTAESGIRTGAAGSQGESPYGVIRGEYIALLPRRSYSSERIPEV
jgi:hypothetical protein